MEFQSTRPVRGATVPRESVGGRGQVSIHAPRTGRDAFLDSGRRTRFRFQSTRPVRGATRAPTSRACTSTGFNPRAPYGARPAALEAALQADEVSIHAPRTGRDDVRRYHPGECARFQSPRPVRGATGGRALLPVSHMVSIHAPRTGRDGRHSSCLPVSHRFQSTRPVRGATAPGALLPGARRRFQSTRPVRGATMTSNRWPYQRRSFNPRAPYGARPWARPSSRASARFNPRAPYGARPLSLLAHEAVHVFQSTRPVRGATTTRVVEMAFDLFQSTRPVRGATSGTQAACLLVGSFNPRAPYGARRMPRSSRRGCLRFNPRAPYGARHALRGGRTRPPAVSIHAPRTGRDFEGRVGARQRKGFQSTRPVRGATWSPPKGDDGRE